MRNLYGHEKKTIVSYPPPMPRRAPEWSNIEMVDLFGDNTVPMPIVRIVHETYVAVQNASYSLAAMGVCAALELIMIDKVGDKGTFKAGLAAFLATGHISTRHADSLVSVLDAGHAAIHRGWLPSQRDVAILLDVMESVVESVYLHEVGAQELAQRVPQRPKSLPKP
jgi:hypothetical protein